MTFNELRAFTNCDIYTGDRVLSQHAVIIRGDRIDSIVEASSIPDGVEIFDLKGLTLAPAFIDVQINGGGGVLFNDFLDVHSIEVISAAHERFGVLNFCPTIISTDMHSIERGVTAIQKTISKNLGVLGAHIEGPFIERTKAGIHEKKYIRPADKSDIDNIVKWNDCIRIITVAPEAVCGEFIEQLNAAGIKVYLGHTNATCAQAIAAFKSGSIGVTHLYNAMSSLGSREPGVVGASFIKENSWAGIIVDGHHVDFTAVMIAKIIKRDRLFFVTDAMPPVGKPDTVYHIGDYEISCIDGRCSTSDGVLAGSALDMASAVRNAVQKCGIPKDEAFRMSSTYVAQMLGIDDLGKISSNSFADLVVLNGQIHVDGIIRRGVYKKL